MYPTEISRTFVTQILIGQDRVQWRTLEKMVKKPMCHGGVL